MNLIAKVGIGTGAVAGASGVGYGIYHNTTSGNKALTTENDSLPLTQNTTTARIAFKAAIIDFDNEKDLTNSKLKKLRSLSTISEQSRFKSAYDKEKTRENSGLDEFKKACNAIYDNIFTKEDSAIFGDFQAYCARNIKDKIGEGEWAGENADWKVRFGKLKQEGKIPVSAELIAIAAVDSVDGATLKKWCADTEGLIFEGENNLAFKDAKASCGKAD